MSDHHPLQPSNERDLKILLYGEILMRSTRKEAKPEELEQLEKIRKELNLTEPEILAEVEHLVKRTF